VLEIPVASLPTAIDEARFFEIGYEVANLSWDGMTVSQ
jgi:hypothetical protein